MDLRLNLLPPEMIHREQKRNGLLLAVGVWLLLVLTVAAAFVVLHRAAVFSQAEQARVLQQRLALEAEAQALQHYAAAEEELLRLRETSHLAMGTPPEWAGLMASIGLHMPPDVWLDKITAIYQTVPHPEGNTADQGAAVGELVVLGRAADHLAVADWLRVMRVIPGLTALRCQYLRDADVSAEQTPVQFEIKAELLPGPPWRLLAAPQTTGDH